MTCKDLPLVGDAQLLIWGCNCVTYFHLEKGQVCGYRKAALFLVSYKKIVPLMLFPLSPCRLPLKSPYPFLIDRHKLNYQTNKKVFFFFLNLHTKNLLSSNTVLLLPSSGQDTNMQFFWPNQRHKVSSKELEVRNVNYRDSKELMSSRS